MYSLICPTPFDEKAMEEQIHQSFQNIVSPIDELIIELESFNALLHG